MSLPCEVRSLAKRLWVANSGERVLVCPLPQKSETMLSELRPIWWNLVARLADLIAILTAVGVLGSPFFAFPTDYHSVILALYLCVVNIVLIGYVLYLRATKPHRYLGAISNIHSVNSNVRDWLAKLHTRARKHTLRSDDFDTDFRQKTSEILGHIADAFTHICGRRCSVCFKEMRPACGTETIGHLKVVARDPQSATVRGLRDDRQKPHEIEKDTPCHSIYTDDKYLQFYGCNDVPTSWFRKVYKSPNRELENEVPEIIEIFGVPILKKWPLSYRSCLVVPVRLIFPSEPNSTQAPKWQLYGFLCIDCNSRNIFNFRKMWRLAASFADALYVYFDGTYYILEKETEPAVSTIKKHDNTQTK